MNINFGTIVCDMTQEICAPGQMLAVITYDCVTMVTLTLKGASRSTSKAQSRSHCNLHHLIWPFWQTFCACNEQYFVKQLKTAWGHNFHRIRYLCAQWPSRNCFALNPIINVFLMAYWTPFGLFNYLFICLSTRCHRAKHDCSIQKPSIGMDIHSTSR